MGTHLELLHSSQDDQLDVLDFLPADEGLGYTCRHGIGTWSMISSITVSTLMPWLAACGANHRRCPKTYLASS